MPYDIFISYSSGDRAFARELEERLEKKQIKAYRDQNRLTASEPYAESIFKALDESKAIVIIWSSRVRSMDGCWKEWVITERERFRLNHQDSPIFYLLIDDTAPDLDIGIQKIHDLREESNPSTIATAKWDEVIRKIKEVIFSDRIEIDCYAIAATIDEFKSLRTDRNLEQALIKLGVSFDEAEQWYKNNREDWRPAGERSLGELLTEVGAGLERVLVEDGVPERYKDKRVVFKTGLYGLWEASPIAVLDEVNRLLKQEFCWFFIDPLSLYHPKISSVAQHIGNHLGKHKGANVFFLDLTRCKFDRSDLRQKMAMVSQPYSLIVKPRIIDSSILLGAVDAWHADDFERVFRDTLRRYNATNPQRGSKDSPERRFTRLGG